VRRPEIGGVDAASGCDTGVWREVSAKSSNMRKHAVIDVTPMRGVMAYGVKRHMLARRHWRGVMRSASCGVMRRHAVLVRLGAASCGWRVKRGVSAMALALRRRWRWRCDLRRRPVSRPGWRWREAALAVPAGQWCWWRWRRLAQVARRHGVMREVMSCHACQRKPINLLNQT
jgi:hypothetical protein